jgi:uncharacterized protein YecT (DUF1311 family)
MTNKSDKLSVRIIFDVVFIVFTISAPFCAWAGSKSRLGTPLPPAIIGTWQVVKVSIDTKATRRLYVQYNDPWLKGRIIHITPEKMTNDCYKKIVCTHPTLTVKRSTAAELFKESMGWRGDDPQIPIPKDYELPIANNAIVETLWVNCENGSFGPPTTSDISDDTWIVPLPNGQLAILWNDNSILILNRLPANAKPKPSFDCAKAKTATEKTICGSVSLASFDLSVAESYSTAIRFFKEEEQDTKRLKQLKTAQKTWLGKRDACGADAACIKKSMLNQISYLTNIYRYFK